MIGGHEVVTLCGSTRFKDEFEEANLKLSMHGCIVLSVCAFSHADNIHFSDETKSLFDELHKRKIDMSDSIFVINKNGYIGESTRSEIEYALQTGKTVNYMFADVSN